MFNAGSVRLAGIYHPPEMQRPGRPVGCLILVGGPQYRAGAHRHYVTLGRFLAARGISVLRFDYRGMGDSEGLPEDLRGRGEDIAAAAQALNQKVGKDAQLFSWGLCEAASAIFLHHDKIPNLSGAIIANPWVADTRLDAKLQFRLDVKSAMSPNNILDRIRGSASHVLAVKQGFLELFARTEILGDDDIAELPDSFAGFIQRNVPTLYLASQSDRERETFDYAVKVDPRWRRAGCSPLIVRHDLEGADHTFSNPTVERQVCETTHAFIDAQTKPVSLRTARA